MDFRIIPVSVILFLCVPGWAGAETGSELIKVRIKAEKAVVRLNPEAEAAVIAEVSKGTVLDAVKKEGEWFEVTLPPDEQGFTLLGYIRDSDVEEIGQMEEPATKPLPVKKPDDNPPSPKPPPAPKSGGGIIPPRKFYAKGTFGFGGGFERIDTEWYKVYQDDREPERISIYPGGGGRVDAIFGVHIIPALSLEIGIGYQGSGATTKEDKVAFSRTVLSGSLVYEFLSSRPLHFYIGAGPGYFFSPKYEEDVGDYKAEIAYHPSFGFHALVGLVKRRPGKPFFFFGELRFEGLMHYTSYKATYQGTYYGDLWNPPSAYHELWGNGIFLILGIGYLF